MRIFDCTTFYNENLILEARFNILNEYVDKFIITESAYSHSGEKKDFNFDISKFESFKNKIIYIKIEEEPKNLIYNIKDGKKTEEGAHIRLNSIKRIADQRNFLKDGIIDASKDDLILYSDNDEIPNLEFFDSSKINNDIIIFSQKLFYYKFNLFCDRYEWLGTKGCKKKNLIDFDWLRNVKAKKYPFYRIDTLFSETKYTNVNIIKNGGWHFSQLKKPDEIYKKLTNAEDHLEFKEAKKTLSDIKDLVKRKVILYDHQAKSSEKKFNQEFKLTAIGIDQMPKYIQNNQIKYKDWLDFN